jgi:hypothetical protein
MALPRIDSPKYELRIPSNGEVVEYRPYLVKEEKILMMAMETKDQQQMIRALRDVIAGCTEGKVQVDTLAMFDLEYVFLKIRGKSVGETTKVGLKCSGCGHKNEVEINLDEVEVQGEVKKSAKVALTDKVGVVLKYPTVKGIQKQLGKQGGSDSEVTMAAVASAIESIYDENDVYSTDDEKAEDVVNFLDSLTSSQFKMISGYFEDMPRLKHEVKFNCASCKTENSQTLEGLTNFF